MTTIKPQTISSMQLWIFISLWLYDIGCSKDIGGYTDPGMLGLAIWFLVMMGYCMGNNFIEITPKNDQTLVIGEGLNLTCRVNDCNTNGKPYFYYKHKDDKSYHQIYETLAVESCTLKLFVHKMEKPGTQYFYCNASRSSWHRYKAIRVFDPTIGKVGCEVYYDDHTTTMSCQGWCPNGKSDLVNNWKGIVRYETKPLRNFTDCRVALPFNGCGIYSFYVNKTYAGKKWNATSQDVNISIDQVKVKVAGLNATMQTPNKVLVSWEPPALDVTDNCPTPAPHYWISYTIQPPGAGEDVLNVTKEYLGKNEAFILTNILPNMTLEIEVAMSFDRHTHGIPKKLTYTTPPDDAARESVTPRIINYGLSEAEAQIIGIVCGSIAAVTVLFVTQCLVRRWYRRNRPVITAPPPVMHGVNGDRWTMSGRSQNSDYTMLPYDTQ